MRLIKSENTLWQKQEGEGSYQETLKLMEIEAGGEINLVGKEGIIVEIPEGKLKNTLTELSANPEFAWLNQLEGREDVDWHQVSLAFDEWDYRQEGLTPAAAAVIAIAVSMVTSPGGALAVTQNTVLGCLLYTSPSPRD